MALPLEAVREPAERGPALHHRDVGDAGARERVRGGHTRQSAAEDDDRGGRHDYRSDSSSESSSIRNIAGRKSGVMPTSPTVSEIHTVSVVAES